MCAIEIDLFSLRECNSIVGINLGLAPRAHAHAHACATCAACARAGFECLQNTRIRYHHRIIARTHTRRPGVHLLQFVYVHRDDDDSARARGTGLGSAASERARENDSSSITGADIDVTRPSIGIRLYALHIYTYRAFFSSFLPSFRLADFVRHYITVFIFE